MFSAGIVTNEDMEQLIWSKKSVHHGSSELKIVSAIFSMQKTIHSLEK